MIRILSIIIDGENLNLFFHGEGIGRWISGGGRIVKVMMHIRPIGKFVENKAKTILMWFCDYNYNERLYVITLIALARMVMLVVSGHIKTGKDLLWCFNMAWGRALFTTNARQSCIHSQHSNPWDHINLISRWQVSQVIWLLAPHTWIGQSMSSQGWDGCLVYIITKVR